jgi:hypothetical protein
MVDEHQPLSLDSAYAVTTKPCRHRPRTELGQQRVPEPGARRHVPGMRACVNKRTAQRGG